MLEHDAPEDLYLALPYLSGSILHVSPNRKPVDGSATTEGYFEVPLASSAQEWKVCLRIGKLHRSLKGRRPKWLVQ